MSDEQLDGDAPLPAAGRRKQRHRFSAVLWLTAFAALCHAIPATPQAQTGQILRVQGSTTFNERILQPNLPRIEQQSGVRLAVVPNKSIWGLIALLEGRTDLAMISAGIEGEIAAAKLTAPDLPFDRLQPFEIARARVAFVVHSSNPVRTLPLATVKRILQGEITNWKTAGGPDLPMRVVATQDGGGTVVAVRTQLLAGAAIGSREAIRLESARHVVKAVEQEPGAFGIAQLGLAKKANVVVVETDAPIEQVLSLVTLGNPAAPARAVIEVMQAAASESPL